jgi:hypothetical protein
MHCGQTCAKRNIERKGGNELKEESDKDFKIAFAAKTGLADWVNSFRITGDIRGRYEGFYGDNSNFIERNRSRYRARIAFIASMLNIFEAGLRLTSGEPVGGFGGDPISGNSFFAIMRLKSSYTLTSLILNGTQ